VLVGVLERAEQVQNPPFDVRLAVGKNPGIRPGTGGGILSRQGPYELVRRQPSQVRLGLVEVKRQGEIDVVELVLELGADLGEPSFFEPREDQGACEQGETRPEKDVHDEDSVAQSQPHWITPVEASAPWNALGGSPAEGGAGVRRPLPTPSGKGGGIPAQGERLLRQGFGGNPETTMDHGTGKLGNESPAIAPS